MRGRDRAAIRAYPRGAALDESQLSAEDRKVLDALEDQGDVEAFKNLIANARAQGKMGVELVQEEPQHTSRKAIRKLCMKDKGGVFAAFVKRLFGGSSRGSHPPGPQPVSFTKPPSQTPPS